MSISMKSMMIFLEGLLPFFPPDWPLAPHPTPFGFSYPHALESDPHCKGSVCVQFPFTNIHCDVRLFLNEPFQLLNPTSLATFGTHVEEYEHFISFFKLRFFMFQLFWGGFPLIFEENVHAPDPGWKLPCDFHD